MPWHPGVGETGPSFSPTVAPLAVNAAGTYSITWTSNPDQGAVVYLVALE